MPGGLHRIKYYSERVSVSNTRASWKIIVVLQSIFRVHAFYFYSGAIFKKVTIYRIENLSIFTDP